MPGYVVLSPGSDPVRARDDRVWEGRAMPDNDTRSPDVPELYDRRRFMRRLLVASGGTAFAVMGGGAVVATAASADDTTTADATPGASASASAPPGDGTGSGPASAVTDDFWGLTTDGKLVDDLFTIHSTGVTTGPVVTAARAFLDSLTDDQLSAVQFGIHDLEWRDWSNVDSYTREGVQLADMTDAQQTAGMALLGKALSAKGLTLSKNIMKINGIAGELIDQADRFADDLYYFTVMGTPSTTDPWGFQFEGHHLVVNYFVLGDQVVMSPNFFGSEPTTVTSDGETTTVFTDEIAAALAAVNALSPAEQATAIISADKTGDDNQAEAFTDNLVSAYEGVNVAGLPSGAQQKVLALVEQFVANMDSGHADVAMAEIRKHLDETYFAWVGATDDDAVFYARVQSPVLYLEFDCELPGPIGQAMGDEQVPSRKHIHSVVRTPNGNDYGKQLLRQHLLTSPHHQR
jgi:uncharacterized protein DUF3500